MLNSMGQAILIKMTLWPDAGAGCKKERTTSKSCNDPIVITFQHRSQMTIWAKLPSSSRAVETQPDLDDLFCYTPITIYLASTETNCNILKASSMSHTNRLSQSLTGSWSFGQFVYPTAEESESWLQSWKSVFARGKHFHSSIGTLSDNFADLTESRVVAIDADASVEDACEVCCNICANTVLV